MKNTSIKNRPNGFVFDKKGYMILLAGILLIISGFILMSGGGSDAPKVFNPEIFNFQRITLAPMVVLFGFMFEIYAIMKKTKSDK